MFISSWPWGRGPPLYSCKDTKEVMRVCPSSLQVLCGLGDHFWLCPSERLMGASAAMWSTGAVDTDHPVLTSKSKSWVHFLWSKTSSLVVIGVCKVLCCQYCDFHGQCVYTQPTSGNRPVCWYHLFVEWVLLALSTCELCESFSVKRLRYGSAPPMLRQWYSATKQWTGPFG